MQIDRSRMSCALTQSNPDVKPSVCFDNYNLAALPVATP
jgi:hypothetical protein